MPSKRNVIESASSVRLMCLLVLILPPLLKAVPLLWPRKKAAPNHLPGFPWELLKWKVLLQSFLVYLCCEWCFLLYLLISNSLMNRLDNGNRWKKSSACVSLTVFCFSIDKLIIDMGVNQDLSVEWWNLVSFDHEIVLWKKTLILMREDGAAAREQWAHTLYLFRADALLTRCLQWLGKLL